MKNLRLNSVGQTHGDFVVTRVTEIKELQCVLFELQHLPTGALVMHLHNEDPENLFCLSFQTLPTISDGVAHILEHTVLCGSEKYPVKDPFFAMTRRSLNTFMNALTGSDFTCYPAATQVPKDFYNLLSVYLDAVFHPQLKELSFLQEGHRLEFSDPKNPNSPLEFKGVVYNEMKGALASPMARLGEAMSKALFPDLTYGINSGGDPKVIPDLTYPGLRAFHQKYYHPSHCLFFFYGNMPLEPHLDFIEANALQNVKKAEPISPIPSQPRFSSPHYLTVDFPIAPEEELEDKTIISFGWLTCHILQQLEVLALCVLEIILMDTDASPLKLALLKSGLCKQAGVSMDIDISEVPVIITLRGCNPENADGLEKVIQETLETVVKEGIPLDLFENALHQLEIFRSEITGNHSPFGLSLFMRSALLKQHGGDPESGLIIHTLFEELRKKHFENPNYLTDLIQEHFIDNTHRVRIVMVPNKELAQKEQKEEQERLAEIRAELSPAHIKEILHKTAELETFQKEQEDDDVDVLPKIGLEDVPKASRFYELDQAMTGTLEVYHHSCFTNHIVYADLTFPFPEVKEEELPLIRLFLAAMPQMGCGGRNYLETLNYIQANTGGIGASLSFHNKAQNSEIFTTSISLRGKALYRKANKLFPLLKEMVQSIDFTDLPRLKEVILKHYTSLQSAIPQQSLRYGLLLASSGIDRLGKISNDLYGLEFFWTLQKFVADIDAQLPILADKFQEYQSRLLGLQNGDLILSCSKPMAEELKQHKLYGLDTVSQNLYTPWKGDYPIPEVKPQGRVIASPVAFTCHVFKTISYVHADTPALSLASCLFDNLTMHPKIREQGGAYGSGAVASTMAGNFYFYSYRDPNISSTLNAFDESIETVVSGKFDQEDLEEAKLEVIQSLDAPIAPGSRGDVAYNWMREGRTREVRQAFRDRLLSLSPQEVSKAVQKHIATGTKSGITVVFAGKELLEKENEQLIKQGRPPLEILPLGI